jgi:hypothetical protein
MLLPPIRLPESTSSWVYSTLFGSGFVALVLWASPELRAALINPAMNILVLSTSTFPAGCARVKVVVPSSDDISEIRLGITRSVEDMRFCNPRNLRISGKSAVTYIAPSTDDKIPPARVTVRLTGGSAEIGVKDYDARGQMGALRCNKRLAGMRAVWEAPVPSTVTLEDYIVPTNEVDRADMRATCEALRHAP